MRLPLTTTVVDKLGVRISRTNLLSGDTACLTYKMTKPGAFAMRLGLQTAILACGCMLLAAAGLNAAEPTPSFYAKQDDLARRGTASALQPDLVDPGGKPSSHAIRSVPDDRVPSGGKESAADPSRSIRIEPHRPTPMNCPGARRQRPQRPSTNPTVWMSASICRCRCRRNWRRPNSASSAAHPSCAARA